MNIHMRNTLNNRPVCGLPKTTDAVMMHSDVDKITCVDCLRRLAKDAVIYGNQRRARKW